MLKIILQSHRIVDQGRELGNSWVQLVLIDKKWNLLAILKCVCVTLSFLNIQQETIIKWLVSNSIWNNALAMAWWYI